MCHTLESFLIHPTEQWTKSKAALDKKKDKNTQHIYGCMLASLHVTSSVLQWHFPKCLQEVEGTLSKLVHARVTSPTVSLITVIIWPDHVDIRPVHMAVQHQITHIRLELLSVIFTMTE